LPEAHKNMNFMTLNGPTDGITDFGIAPAKHCNLAFCSLFYKSTDQKPFLAEHAITCGVKGLTSLICLWCNARI